MRNSILLVDFINQSVAGGHDLADAVVEACVVRAQPIALIFGILVSTVLTLVVIPLLYFVLLRARARRGLRAGRAAA